MNKRDFFDIDKMVDRYKTSSLRDDGILKGLDMVDFFGFIYQLVTGRFEATGFSNKSFLRYFMTSGQTDSDNMAMDIVNNLPYGSNEFMAKL